ncbi:Bug family tripartite tricarboxylate transporter substrate binding protein [Roseomonas chloroacetimidivorans]|uniref:Bug family tripartite tricarboxylate transporter substrate binding protein n=1 Tax=Roseomonas chloroacetimidivorans TaxID=1766656 RepID=UPI003C791227
MTIITRRSALASTLSVIAAPRVRAQGSWPDRPVRVVVPYSAGGIADVIARILQPRMADYLGQPVVIENRTGASGAIAAQVVAQAPADGYTMLFEGPTVATLPEVRNDLPVDYATAFVPVVQVMSQPYILGIRPGFPAKDMAGFIAEAKRRPGEVTYGTPGVAHTAHFMAELLQMRADIKLEHVPFRGGSDVARELAGERIDAGIISFSSFRPAVDRGARLIGSTVAQRQAILPDIPTIAETVPGYEMTAWTGFFAPARTPQSVLARFTGAAQSALANPDVQRQIEGTGSDVVQSDQSAFAALIQRDREAARRIVRATGMSMN